MPDRLNRYSGALVVAACLLILTALTIVSSREIGELRAMHRGAMAEVRRLYTEQERHRDEQFRKLGDRIEAIVLGMTK